MYITDHNVRRYGHGMWAPAFTLVEVILVIVILAIGALVAMPAFSGASEMQLKAAADKLGADIEYAKSMAVTTQKNHRVSFDTTNGYYEIQVLNGVTWAAINDPIKKGSTFRVTYSQLSRLSHVTINSAAFNGTAVVQFDYTGTPLDGSGVSLPAAGVVTLGAGTQTTTVTVEPVTGFISVQ
jgi:prepilin-type N-terminal cleavage/methylation domain-containing protein